MGIIVGLRDSGEGFLEGDDTTSRGGDILRASFNDGHSLPGPRAPAGYVSPRTHGLPMMCRLEAATLSSGPRASAPRRARICCALLPLSMEVNSRPVCRRVNPPRHRYTVRVVSHPDGRLPDCSPYTDTQHHPYKKEPLPYGRLVHARDRRSKRARRANPSLLPEDVDTHRRLLQEGVNPNNLSKPNQTKPNQTKPNHAPPFITSNPVVVPSHPRTSAPLAVLAHPHSSARQAHTRKG
ncbi:uncharacterized protein LY79DRAFT_278555 [Colletotrichum navitas]|uniref:Uncharacterized protein n=1 Tax=Colletotrichum navitas TaxID=681940 RepID=A0AAD8V3N3_9PEZI|nr:uncharacterized protein LY79DRAFT_278555 [Colletotrichum navitas]KAK1585085.1 hypothetical protein LY79DRAFT_278555 [Colletotrichum navitas]